MLQPPYVPDHTPDHEYGTIGTTRIKGCVVSVPVQLSEGALDGSWGELDHVLEEALRKADANAWYERRGASVVVKLRFTGRDARTRIVVIARKFIGSIPASIKDARTPKGAQRRQVTERTGSLAGQLAR